MRSTPQRGQKRAAGLLAAAACVALLLCSSCSRADDPEAERVRAGLQADLFAAQEKAAEAAQEKAKLTDKVDSLLTEKKVLELRYDEDTNELREAVREHKLAANRLQAELDRLRAERPVAARSDAPMQPDQARKKLEHLTTILFERGDYAVARSTALTAVELGSSAPQLLYQLGYCEAVRGDNEAACDSYSKAVENLTDQTPPDEALLVKTLSNWGAAAAGCNRPKEAEQLYVRALGIDGTYAPAWYNLGLLLATDPERKDQAAEAFRKHIVHGGSRAATARQKLRELLGVGEDAAG